jgi:two-component system, cell cycle response regulator
MARTEESERTSHTMPRPIVPGQKHAFLLVLSGPQLGDLYPLPNGRELVLGRRDDADLALRDDGVSRRHATIRVDDGQALVRDAESQNGIYVGGERVREARLSDGDRFQLGASTTLKYVFADELEARYQLKLAESAVQDSLTGVYNRRHLEDRLAAELAAAQRHQRPVAVLLIDVDHFKRVNDRFGHLACDEALRMMAFVLRGAVRKEDVLGRFGGEEFVVVARETALDGARILGERIRCAVEHARCAWHGTDLGLTVSIGVTVSSGHAKYVAGKTDRALLDAADRALYAAKAAGRNRVVAMDEGEK